MEGFDVIMDFIVMTVGMRNETDHNINITKWNIWGRGMAEEQGQIVRMKEKYIGATGNKKEVKGQQKLAIINVREWTYSKPKSRTHVVIIIDRKWKNAVKSYFVSERMIMVDIKMRTSTCGRYICMW